jgi:hypothetical protein
MSGPSRFASLSIASLALFGALAPAAPEKADPNQELAREQLKVVERALKDMETLMSHGELNLSDPKYSVWSRRKIEALRATKAGKAETVAALEDYVARMKGVEQFAAAALKAGQGGRIDLEDAQYRRLEAEILLNEEKAR